MIRTIADDEPHLMSLALAAVINARRACSEAQALAALTAAPARGRSTPRTDLNLI
ncbi:hypothetical protein ACOJBM_21215 [Rhizobium beringeri]